MEADAALKHEVRQTMQAITSMQIQQEYLTMSVLRDNTILTAGATLTAPDQWDNDLSPDSFPLQDLQDACLQVMVNTGAKANRIVMHSFTLAALRRHRKSLAVFGIAPNVGALASIAQIEEWIGCEKGAIIETAAHYNAAQEKQTDDFARLSAQMSSWRVLRNRTLTTTVWACRSAFRGKLTVGRRGA